MRKTKPYILARQRCANSERRTNRTFPQSNPHCKQAWRREWTLTTGQTSPPHPYPLYPIPNTRGFIQSLWSLLTKRAHSQALRAVCREANRPERRGSPLRMPKGLLFPMIAASHSG